jgi:uncharacterized protein (UPF0276 family)
LRNEALSSVRPAGTRALPFLGSGLGYRAEIRQQVLAAAAELDFVEIITERYANRPSLWRDLELACERFAVIPHGVSLSIGSARGPDPDHLRAIKRVSERTRSPYYSEHLALTGVPGIDLGHLSPLWFTEEALAIVARNVRQVQEYLEKPLVLENVTYYFELPHRQMSQPEFFHRLVEATGCGILLDVTNVHVNATNHGFDPLAFLEAMPLAAVVQVHLAGGTLHDGFLIDGHCAPVAEESWRLLEALVARTAVRGAILEHDDRFPEFSCLLEQVARAREILNRHGSGSDPKPGRRAGASESLT